MSESSTGRQRTVRDSAQIGHETTEPPPACAASLQSDTGALLGNFPQAFSHLGLINAAWSIDEATRRNDQEVA